MKILMIYTIPLICLLAFISKGVRLILKNVNNHFFSVVDKILNPRLTSPKNIEPHNDVLSTIYHKCGSFSLTIVI